MMGRGIYLLIATIGLCFIIMTSMAFVLMTTKRSKRLDARIDQVVRPHAQVRSASSTGLISLATPTSSRLSRYMTRWLLYDPVKRDRYLIPFPLVILLSLCVGCAAFTVLGLAYHPLAWPAGLISTVFTCRMIYSWFDQKIKRVLFNQFPDALGMIVRAVRVGVPVAESIGIVAQEASNPTAKEFGRVAEEVAIGGTLEEALRNMAERNPLPEYSFFAVTLSLQSQTGGGLTETLENLADTVRKRAAARERGSALASEAKMSMYILAALPPCAGAIMLLVNSSYIMVLFEKPAGERIVAVACMFWCFGMVSMRALIRKSLS